MSILMTVVNT